MKCKIKMTSTKSRSHNTYEAHLELKSFVELINALEIHLSTFKKESKKAPKKITVEIK